MAGGGMAIMPASLIPWALIKAHRIKGSMQQVTEEVIGVEERSGGTVHKLCLCGCAHACVTVVTLL